MIAALIVAIGMGLMNSFHVSMGTGYVLQPLLQSLLWTLPDQRRRYGSDLDLGKILVPTLKHWYAYQMVYPWTLFFVKTSILALYHRIFKQANFRFAVYIVTAFVSVYMVLAFFVNVTSLALFGRHNRLAHYRHLSTGGIFNKRGLQPFLKAATICRRPILQHLQSTSSPTSRFSSRLCERSRNCTCTGESGVSSANVAATNH